MTMETMQIRMGQGLIQRVDKLVKTGIYTNRSDAIRDAVRRLILSELIGIIPNKENSVKQIKTLRRKLSKEKFDLEKINKLAD
ncbi:ribbon-helix-helix protein, CopG family [Candidatus Pacearchaeota archaeon]|nr:ribbon-helix-helix protein, CopG family [Candidatus Pacearchaeota archaeon]